MKITVPLFSLLFMAYTPSVFAAPTCEKVFGTSVRIPTRIKTEIVYADVKDSFAEKYGTPTDVRNFRIKVKSRSADRGFLRRGGVRKIGRPQTDLTRANIVEFDSTNQVVRGEIYLPEKIDLNLFKMRQQLEAFNTAGGKTSHHVYSETFLEIKDDVLKYTRLRFVYGKNLGALKEALKREPRIMSIEMPFQKIGSQLVITYVRYREEDSNYNTWVEAVLDQPLVLQTENLYGTPQLEKTKATVIIAGGRSEVLEAKDITNFSLDVVDNPGPRRDANLKTTTLQTVDEPVAVKFKSKNDSLLFGLRDMYLPSTLNLSALQEKTKIEEVIFQHRRFLDKEKINAYLQAEDGRLIYTLDYLLGPAFAANSFSRTNTLKVEMAYDRVGDQIAITAMRIIFERRGGVRSVDTVIALDKPIYLNLTSRFEQIQEEE